MSALASEDRKSRKLLLIVAIAAVVIVATAFVRAATRVKVIPYSKGVWESGKGVYTTGNPRLKMRDEVWSRVWSGGMRESDVIKLLGPREDAVSIKKPGGVVETPWGVTSGHWVYVLGIEPKSMWQGRSLRLLTVEFDKRGQVKNAHQDVIDFPRGSTIVAAKYGPAPPVSTKAPMTKTGP